MSKINYMSTLFVGIDVSSKINAVYAMDFEENKYISSSLNALHGTVCTFLSASPEKKPIWSPIST